MLLIGERNLLLVFGRIGYGYLVDQEGRHGGSVMVQVPRLDRSLNQAMAEGDSPEERKFQIRQMSSKCRGISVGCLIFVDGPNSVFSRGSPVALHTSEICTQLDHGVSEGLKGSPRRSEAVDTTNGFESYRTRTGKPILRVKISDPHLPGRRLQISPILLHLDLGHVRKGSN